MKVLEYVPSFICTSQHIHIPHTVHVKFVHDGTAHMDRVTLSQSLDNVIAFLEEGKKDTGSLSRGLGGVLHMCHNHHVLMRH